MANGDVTITVAIAGGSVSKTVTVATAHRVKALAWLNRNHAGTEDDPDLTDDTWAAHIANSAASGIIHAAEKQLIVDAAPTTPTFEVAV